MRPDFPLLDRVTAVQSPDFTQSAAFFAAPEHQARNALFRRSAAGTERDGYSSLVCVDVVKTKHFAAIVVIQVDHVISRRHGASRDAERKRDARLGRLAKGCGSEEHCSGRK